MSAGRRKPVAILFGRLRFAVVISCLVAHVLLIALWLRSQYWRDELVVHELLQRQFTICSLYGELALDVRAAINTRPGQPSWKMKSLWAYKVKMVPINGEPIANAAGFGRRITNLSSTIVIPYWFLTLLAAVLPLSLRRRFSLRDLLLVVTLTAVLLGIIMGSQ